MAVSRMGRSRVAASLTGYLHPQYAESLIEYGVPRELPRAGGWVLQRQIPDSDCRDATGCYPLFCCQDWSQLHLDLEDLADSLVSLTVVTDPFGDYDNAYLKQCFPDVMVPFKQHFVIDLGYPIETYVHSHHRRYIRRALRELHVERCMNPSDYVNDWTALYGTLIERHHITGLTAFSKESFITQLAVPGIVAFRATREGVTLGMLLWYIQNGVAYYHLGAYSLRGYELRASYALFNSAIEYFAQQGFRWLNLGGAAGVGTDSPSGLSRFKAGWSNASRTAYFCGRIFDRAKYTELSKARRVEADGYFPAYRRGEFN